MSRRWAVIIIFTVIVVVLVSGFEIFKAFSEEKEVGEFQKYSTSISREFNVDLLSEVKNKQSEVLVKDEDIAPETND